MNLGELKDKIRDMPDDTIVVFKSSGTVNDFESIEEVTTGEVEPGTPPGYYLVADKTVDRTDDSQYPIEPAIILS